MLTEATDVIALTDSPSDVAVVPSNIVFISSCCVSSPLPFVFSVQLVPLTFSFFYACPHLSTTFGILGRHHAFYPSLEFYSLQIR
ncbi:hypothetical protein HanRHA438_Chr05g0203911 [Helianthus annuus]|nr:hypothetical protein HanRHA438_Chr05g0203911 [Helianthus annuus]